MTHWKRKQPLPMHLFSQAHIQQRSQRASMTIGLCGDGVPCSWTVRATVLRAPGHRGPLFPCLHSVYIKYILMITDCQVQHQVWVHFTFGASFLLPRIARISVALPSATNLRRWQELFRRQDAKNASFSHFLCALASLRLDSWQILSTL